MCFGDPLRQHRLPSVLRFESPGDGHQRSDISGTTYLVTRASNSSSDRRRNPVSSRSDLGSYCVTKVVVRPLTLHGPDHLLPQHRHFVCGSIAPRVVDTFVHPVVDRGLKMICVPLPGDLRAQGPTRFRLVTTSDAR